MPRAPQLRSWEEDNDMDAPTFVNLAAPRVVRLAPVIRSVHELSGGFDASLYFGWRADSD